MANTTWRSEWKLQEWLSYCERDLVVKYRQRKHHKIVLDYLQPHPGDVILEVGCGWGRLTSTLIQAGAIVIAVDLSRDMVNFSRRRFRPEYHQGVVADAYALPVRNSAFDKVPCTCNGVLRHLKNPVLRPGGCSWWTRTRRSALVSSWTCSFTGPRCARGSLLGRLTNSLAGLRPRTNPYSGCRGPQDSMSVG